MTFHGAREFRDREVEIGVEIHGQRYNDNDKERQRDD